MLRMDNFGRATDLATSALNSQGSAMEKYNIYADSIAGTTERITALWQDFVNRVDIESVLKGLLDLLEQNEENPNKKEQLENCIYLTERMNDLIRTMLELAKLEADAIELKFLNHNCKSMVENAVFAAKSSRPNSNVNFKFEIDNDLEIRCDSKWFGQALVNIIVNAIDYSKTDGCIHIIAIQNGGVITLKVNDQGGGIAENELPKIFNRFYRAANSPKGGFGIGLSMAESIIKLHKGNIRAINENDGLSMVISLPLLCCAENI